MQPGPMAGLEPDQSATYTFRALFQNPDWDYHSMDFDKDIATSDKLGNTTINAADPAKLKALFDRGGKIRMYHGWNDPAITPLISIQYYKMAVDANGGEDKTYDSIRLFMAPGKNHCGGGEGPNAFDKMDPISDWFQNGEAPNQIVASHSNAAGEVDRTRPLSHTGKWRHTRVRAALMTLKTLPAPPDRRTNLDRSIALKTSYTVGLPAEHG